MHGGGIKLQITRNSPAAAHLLDLTRTVSRCGRRPTGIDRVELAYLEHLIAFETPLFGVVRTKLGYLLLDKAGCAQLLAHSRAPMWTEADLLSRFTRRTNAARGATEAGLRRIALDRATPARLRQILARHVPRGAVYFNIGQTNFNERVIQGLRACDIRIAVYVHDTIPLDCPETQTAKSRQNFARFLTLVDRWANLVLCNSADTRARIADQASHRNLDTIHVIWPGRPEMTVGDAPQGGWTGKAYFMSIGTLEPRKNIGFLLDLWSAFAGPNDPQLLLCGRRGWMNEAVFARLDAHPANVHELNDLGDPALWALLAESRGLLFPSLAEGFGYPAIEAAHLNVPLICNPLAVFKEVLGDYPIYAAESDRYAWANNIEQLAQRRRDQGGEQDMRGRFEAPTWQDHFDRLFTVL